jgi:hypothetical protein
VRDEDIGTVHQDGGVEEEIIVHEGHEEHEGIGRKTGKGRGRGRGRLLLLICIFVLLVNACFINSFLLFVCFVVFVPLVDVFPEGGP